MSMKEQKSFIEVTFPIKEVSEESAREKNIRQGTFQLFTSGGQGDLLPHQGQQLMLL